MDKKPKSSHTPFAVVILAAGKGTRMKSTLPKVMHKLAGRPMISWVVEKAEALGADKIIVVTAPDMDDVAAAVAPHATALQREQKGTGDALKAAMPALKNFKGKVLVLLGDEPLVDTEILKDMIAHEGLSVMAVHQDNPTGLGRMVIAKDGMLEAIVEEKDASAAQKEITLCNAGNFCFPAAPLAEWVAKLENKNAQGEYYLTDIPVIAKAAGHSTKVFTAECLGRWGINSRVELAEHEYIVQSYLRAQAMDSGVTMIDPDSVTLSWDTILGRDVIIEPNVFLGTGVRIADNVTIHAFSHIEGAEIEAGAEIGPFARIRPKSVIGAKASVGNFIEINRSTLKAGAKAKHVSYIGDSEIGEKTNIGAGTIIANYDGFFKHKSTIGKDVFIGSNSTIISPVQIGDGAIVAANSTINKDIPGNAMAVARARQENHLGWASEYRKVKQQQKKQEED